MPRRLLEVVVEEEEQDLRMEEAEEVEERNHPLKTVVVEGEE